MYTNLPSLGFYRLFLGLMVVTDGIHSLVPPLADASSSSAVAGPLNTTLGEAAAAAAEGVRHAADAVSTAYSAMTATPMSSSSTQLVGHRGDAILAGGAHVANDTASWSVSATAIAQQSWEKLEKQLRLSWESPPDLSTLLMQLVHEQPLWLLGVGFMVLGTLSSACGMLLLKRATLGPGPVPPWYKNVWFWAGMMLIIVNASLLDIVAFAVTPLSLIAPFAGLTIVFSVVLVGVGCFGVREVPSPMTMISVGVIVFGVTIAATFGPHEDKALRPADMQQILDERPGIFWAGITGLPAVALLQYVSARHEAALKAVLGNPVGSLLAAVAGAAYGGLTQLLFKTAATAVVSVVQTWSFPYPSGEAMAMQLSCAACCALAQVVFLNVAIGSSPVAYAVPAYQSALLLITLSLAGWLLDEFGRMEPLNYGLFTTGCGFVLLGIALNAVALRRAAMRKERVDHSLPIEEGKVKGGEEAAPTDVKGWAPRSLRATIRRP